MALERLFADAPAGARTGRDRLEPALPRRTLAPPGSVPRLLRPHLREARVSAEGQRDNLRTSVSKRAASRQPRPQFCVFRSPTDWPPSLGQGKLVLLLAVRPPVCAYVQLAVTAARRSDRLHCHARRTATGTARTTTATSIPMTPTGAITLLLARGDARHCAPLWAGPGSGRCLHGCPGLPLDGPLVVRQLDPAPGFDVFAFRAGRQRRPAGNAGRADRWR